MELNHHNSWSTGQLGEVINNRYPGSGYAVLVPNNLSSSLQLLQQLETQKWLDFQTRVLFIEFNLFNPNLNLLSSFQAMVEFPLSGGALTSHQTYISPVYGVTGNWRYAIEIVFVFAGFVLLCQVAHKIYVAGGNFFIFWRYGSADDDDQYFSFHSGATCRDKIFSCQKDCLLNYNRSQIFGKRGRLRKLGVTFKSQSKKHELVKWQADKRMLEKDVVERFQRTMRLGRLVQVAWSDVCPRFFQPHIEIRHELSSFMLPVYGTRVDEDKWQCAACGCKTAELWQTYLKNHSSCAPRQPRLRRFTSAAWNYFDAALVIVLISVFFTRNESLKFFNRTDRPLLANQFTDFQYHLEREYQSVVLMSICALALLFKLASFFLEIPGLNLIFGTCNACIPQSNSLDCLTLLSDRLVCGV